MVDGLNSVSTAKKWVTLIKEISGHEFKKVQARNNRQFISFYNFTNDDVEDFRTIAYLKNEMSLKDAIRATYGDIQKRKEYSLAQQLETLKEDFITLNDNFKNLYSNNKILQMKFQRLEKEQEEILSTLELLPFGAWEKARRKFGK